mgnify:CR=1 FL=1
MSKRCSRARGVNWKGVNPINPPGSAPVLPRLALGFNIDERTLLLFRLFVGEQFEGGADAGGFWQIRTAGRISSNPHVFVNGSLENR